MPKFVDTSGIYVPFDDTAGFPVLNPGNFGLPSGDNVGGIEARLISDALTFLTSEIQLVPSSGAIIVGSGTGQWATLPSGQLFAQVPSGLDANEFWGNETVISLKVITGSGLDAWLDRERTTFYNMSRTGTGGINVTDARFNGGNSGVWFEEGENEYLTNISLNGVIFNGTDVPYTVIAVFEPATSAEGRLNTIVAGSDSLSAFNSQTFLGITALGGVQLFKRNSTSSVSKNIIVAPGTIQYGVGNVQLVSWVDTGSLAQIYRNGLELTAGASGSDVGAISTSNFSIGAFNKPTDENFYDGAMLEVAVFDGALSDADRKTVENLMMSKWGITNDG